MNSESALKLLLIDNDPIFRMGLKFSCEQFSDIEIAIETEVSSEVLKIIQNLNIQDNNFLVILDIETNNLLSQTTEEIRISGLGFCQQLKILFPELRILLLTYLQDSLLLTRARKLGVNGYCPKGISISELVIIIRQIANGKSYWEKVPGVKTIQENSEKIANSSSIVQIKFFFNTIVNNFCKSGIKQIDYSLLEVISQLNEREKNLDRNNLISLLNVAITSGQRRELLTARWILSQLSNQSCNTHKQQKKIDFNRDNFFKLQLQNITKVQTNKIINSVNNDLETFLNKSTKVIYQTSAEAVKVQTALFEETIAKLNSNLINFSELPMEIDILRGYKKQELIYITLSKFEYILDKLRSTSIMKEEIPRKKYEIIHHLWELTSQVFFNEDYQPEITNSIGTLNYFSEKMKLEVMPILLNESDNVHKFILDKIPLVEELIAYLLFEVPLLVDNVSFAVGTPEAMERSEALLQNLLISVANGVLQPLLNNFAHVEEIKEYFYDQQLLSTRDIEKFRNRLSWKYLIQQYIGEPKAIFESNFFLFVLNERGIKRISIYSPRRHELEKLSGIPLTLTLLLEARDAIAPGIRATVSFIGSGIVYLLTQVIGRGIGLIGRGIIQGVGNSFQDIKFGKNNKMRE
ncbi:MAG: DUF3685 domain-containing protein [Trichodesmium sp. MAG_R04]|nr:DUF3685 domain-containing protein [Trichodesmium sp. MAG_R04]